MGWVDSNAGQIVNQATAAAVAWALAIVPTQVILRVCDTVNGVRADSMDEVEGLDLSMHGEEGHNFEA